MHRSTFVLVVFAFALAGCADACGRACGNAAYNRTLAAEVEDWRFDGPRSELEAAAAAALRASRGASVPADCFGPDGTCRVSHADEDWTLRVNDARGGFVLEASSVWGDGEPSDDPVLIVDAIARVDAAAAERIRATASAAGERARSRTLRRCHAWREAVSEAGDAE